MKRLTPRTDRHSAGWSARASYRSNRTLVSRMSWKARLFSLAGITLAGAILGFAAGGNIALFAGGAAMLAIVAGGLLLAPQSMAMLGMFIAYAALSMLLGPMFAYAAAPSEETLNASVLATLGMWIAGAAAFWASVKFSRRTVWVTYLLTLVGSILFGGLIAIIEPEMGLFAVYAPMVIILIWRSVIGEWVRGGISLSYVTVRGWFSKKDQAAVSDTTPDLDDEWLRREHAEKLTADILADIDDITVFHDRQLGKTDVAIPHIAITPAGVVVMASIITESKIIETKAFGVEIDDVPLGYVASTLVGIRDDLSKAIKARKADISLMIVMHSTTRDDIAMVNRKIGVFTSTDSREPGSTIRLVGANMLPLELDLGFESLPRPTRQAITARANMKLRPARPTGEGEYTQVENAALGAIDADGGVERPYAVDSAAYSALAIGVKVRVRTEEGLLDDIIVASEPYLDEEGHLVVALALAEEWEAAHKEEREIDTAPFRVDTISVSS